MRKMSKSRLFVAASALALIMGGGASAYAQDTTASLQDQINSLQKQLAQIQSAQAKMAKEQAARAAKASTAAPAPAPTSDYATKGSFPGSIRIPGTETSFKIGGYVKLDAIENIGTGYDQSYARFSMLPLSNTAAADRSAQTTFAAQQSRLTLESRTPSSWGEIKTYFEGDFYAGSAANSNTSGYGFELRHGYGSVGAAKTGQILAGQTWSNFMDVTAMPESLDYIGPAGTIMVRQPQIRYTQDVGPVTLSASVEVQANLNQATQNAVYQANTSTLTAVSTRPQMPDVVVRGDYNYAKDGYVSLRALANQINIDHQTGTTVANESTEVKYGYGFAMSGKQGVLTKDAVLYDFVVGKGTGRYDFDVGAGGNFYNTATGTLRTQTYYGGTLGYQHIWTDTLRSNLFGGFARIVNDTEFMNTALKGYANRWVASGHANLLWQPTPTYKVGIEYMHGYRRVESGVEGNLNRVEASFFYNF